MKLLNNIRIRYKLPAIMLFLMALVVIVFGQFAERLEEDALTEEVAHRLSSVLEAEVAATITHFEQLADELSRSAGDSITIRTLRGMATAWTAYKGDPAASLRQLYVQDNPYEGAARADFTQADDKSQYSAIHATAHPVFAEHLREFGYYDIFLFDAAGNLLYTVVKEDDFGTSMLDGPYSDTGLARAYRRAMELDEGQQAFEDFAAYGPSSGAPAAFLAQPVFARGERVGVIAYQLPETYLHELAAEVRGLGETGDFFLVGEDGLFRSNRRFADAPTMLTEAEETTAVRAALSGESGTDRTVTADGVAVLQAYQPVTFFGATWAGIISVDEAEALGAVSDLRWMLLAVGLGTIALGAVIAALVSSSLSRPLHRVTGAIAQIADGDLDAEVADAGRGDEIGRIARRLERFREQLKAAEADRIASRFRGAAFSASTAPIMMLGLDGKILHANRAIRKLFEEQAGALSTLNPEFQGGDVRGTPVGHVLPEDVAGRVEALMAEGNMLPASLGMPLGDMRLVLSIGRVTDDAGNGLGYVIELKDVTDGFLSKAVLESIDGYQLRAEFLPGGTLKAVNETFCTVMGQPETEFVGREIQEWLTAEDEDDAALSSRLRAGEPVFGLFRLRKQGDDPVLIEGGITPVTDSDGDLLRYILIASDVTKARRAEQLEERRRAEHEAAQAQVVERLRAALGGLAHGDLSVRIEEAFAEAYESLRTDFNAAAHQLATTIEGVAANSEEIRGGAAEISSAADDMSQRTERQAATLEETAAALDQLTHSVKQAAEGAAEANRIVNSARENAETSGEIVREAVDAMGEISASSKQISRITEVIDDISYQTNLLALNAGVEAARAGEAGRGFAVVASEVRALAQRSSDAAREINELISSSGRQVKRGVDLVGQAGDALKSIVTGVVEMSRHVAEIATSSQSQSTGLAEINAAVGELDQVTQQNAAMFEEATAAGHALTREADLLTQAMAKFRTGDSNVVRVHPTQAAGQGGAPRTAAVAGPGSSRGTPPGAGSSSDTSGKGVGADPKAKQTGGTNAPLADKPSTTERRRASGDDRPPQAQPVAGGATALAMVDPAEAFDDDEGWSDF
ncbi:methyl-accepting chemotaxis protein [Psychromarinibacter sp. S121]|uniref:methyl-accepting chemotaxis protein n=1 Tax=Psychromarinibacter sp. S121 TaxID=3415127 RepID=UPI003C7EB54D